MKKESLSLKNLKFHEDMSEETPCFSADLYKDGKLFAYVKNSGRGGCNDYTPAKGVTHQDVQPLYGLDLDCHVMGLAEELNFVKKNQTSKLVLKKDDNFYTLKYKHSFSKIRKGLGKGYEKWIKEQVKKQEDEGYKVLNTNLGI